MEDLKLKPTQATSLKELLLTNPGTAHAIKILFDYHYDQLLREIRQELLVTYGSDSQTIWDNISDDLYETFEEAFPFPSTNNGTEDFINNL